LSDVLGALIRRLGSRALSLVRSAPLVAGRWPVIRDARATSLRRLHPLAGGRQRGTPVIRYYWERFLDAHRSDVRGRALEIGGTSTLGRIGGERVTETNAMDLAARDGVAIVADLSRADALESAGYDCFVIPFTMHLIYDLDAALHHAIRLLKPGGVLLVNFPCVDYYFADGLDMGTGRPLHMFWWFTPLQVENLLRRAGLDAEAFTLTSYGNLFARVAYQMNMAAEELTTEERDFIDRGHPLLVCARIVRPAEWPAAAPPYRDPWLPSTVPQAWNRVTGHYPPQSS